jgi:tetratricopeptide (TPR) repeat protein
MPGNHPIDEMTRRTSRPSQRTFQLWIAAASTALGAACADGGAGYQGGAMSADSLLFVGLAACAECHEGEVEAWAGSHHDLAMQEVSEETVLGDFGDAVFTYFGETYRFFRRGADYLVEVVGPDGVPNEYEIAYAFGFDPLQQFLVRFPGGRLQALGVAWDARPSQDGGQRWFHLYPDEEIAADDVLHWTGLAQNWNYMCAECHSTNLSKGYVLAEDRYETSWAEIDVSCEACHGPGSRHAAWAREREGDGSDPGEETQDRPGDEAPSLPAAEMGLVVDLSSSSSDWVFDQGSAIARKDGPASNTQVDACGRCHSRRSAIADPYEHGRPLTDTHLPATLSEGLYHSDGQIDDEVYVYGSFLQSRMFAAGVTCTDCHDAHSLTLLATGNALCGRCHLPDAYDVWEHHFHEPDSTGAQCVGCHMTSKIYMVVDPRRDHSFRAPRPDLSLSIGVPNACTGCHADRSVGWAAGIVAEWYAPEDLAEDTVRGPHFGVPLAAAREGRPLGVEALPRLVDDSDLPAIVRATAADLLARHPSPQSLLATARALGDADPLVRAAAVRGMEAVEPDRRLTLVAPLLTDVAQAVRIEAGRVLAPVPSEVLTPAQRVELDRAIGEYVEAQLVNADHPSAHVNLGLLEANRRNLAAAERELLMAIRIGPHYVPAYINLADVYRVQGRDAEGETLLREALALLPDEAAIHHTLGLVYARQQRWEEASTELSLAVEAAPENARFAFVYGIALNSAGQSPEAIEVLKAALDGAPWDRDLLIGLATIHRDRGQLEAALEYARRLVENWPEDTGARRLLAELESSAG